MNVLYTFPFFWEFCKKSGMTNLYGAHPFITRPNPSSPLDSILFLDIFLVLGYPIKGILENLDNIVVLTNSVNICTVMPTK